MLGNFNPKAIQDLSKLRAETLKESPLENLCSKYLENQSHFSSIEELNEFLNKLPDDEFEVFTTHIIKNLEKDNEL
tara:strand:- start:111 stop:338 length:228 start_codon:yes stop_codon:yes gene_type:complete